MRKQVSVSFMVCGLLFTTCLIVANIVEQKLIAVGPIEATAGLLIFPVSYIVNDLIAEVWGYRKARLIIWYGFLMNFVAVAVFRLSILVPGSGNFHQQEAFALVLGNTTRITVASFVAFLFGSFLNAYVMSRLKILQHGRGFSLRGPAPDQPPGEMGEAQGAYRRVRHRHLLQAVESAGYLNARQADSKTKKAAANTQSSTKFFILSEGSAQSLSRCKTSGL